MIAMFQPPFATIGERGAALLPWAAAELRGFEGRLAVEIQRLDALSLSPAGGQAGPSAHALGSGVGPAPSPSPSPSPSPPAGSVTLGNPAVRPGAGGPPRFQGAREAAASGRAAPSGGGVGGTAAGGAAGGSAKRKKCSKCGELGHQSNNTKCPKFGKDE